MELKNSDVPQGEFTRLEDEVLLDRVRKKYTPVLRSGETILQYYSPPPSLISTSRSRLP